MSTEPEEVHRETARSLGVHEDTIRNWADRGILQSLRLPGQAHYVLMFRGSNPRQVDLDLIERSADATILARGTHGRSSWTPRRRRRHVAAHLL